MATRSDSTHSAWSRTEEDDDVAPLQGPPAEHISDDSHDSGRTSDTNFTFSSFRMLPSGLRLSHLYGGSRRPSVAIDAEAIPAEAADATVHGWLNKMGGKAPYNWRKRFFAIDAETCTLRYYSLSKDLQ
eukprot:1583950-Prymnesium_polylepis.1